jgi:hypothetical protein
MSSLTSTPVTTPIPDHNRAAYVAAWGVAQVNTVVLGVLKIFNSVLTNLPEMA